MKLDAIVFLGQVLAEGDHGGRIAEAHGEVGMMLRSPQATGAMAKPIAVRAGPVLRFIWKV